MRKIVFFAVMLLVAVTLISGCQFWNIKDSVAEENIKENVIVPDISASPPPEALSGATVIIDTKWLQEDGKYYFFLFLDNGTFVVYRFDEKEFTKEDLSSANPKEELALAKSEPVAVIYMDEKGIKIWIHEEHKDEIYRLLTQTLKDTELKIKKAW